MSDTIVKHPYIVTNEAISQGSAIIQGTRVRIIDIIIEYEYLGWDPDTIAAEHPQLTLAQIHDALSFYYENRKKIDQEIIARKASVAELKQQYKKDSTAWGTDILHFYTDESVPIAIAEGLKRRGIPVHSARDAGNLGLTDAQQLSYAFQEHYVIFTHDDDFLVMAMRVTMKHNGIIYVHQQKVLHWWNGSQIESARSNHRENSAE